MPKKEKIAEAQIEEKGEQNNYELVQSNLEAGKELYESVVIKTDEDLAGVSDKVKQIKLMGKALEERKEKFTGPAKLIIAEAKNIFDEAINWFKNAEKDLKQKSTIYMLEKEKQNQAKQDKIAADLAAGKIDTDKAVDKLEKLPETSKNVQTGNSQMQLRKRKVAKIIDPNLIPDEFWVIDEVRVRREALERDKNNLPQIPGMFIDEEASMASL